MCNVKNLRNQQPAVLMLCNENLDLIAKKSVVWYINKKSR